MQKGAKGKNDLHILFGMLTEVYKDKLQLFLLVSFQFT